MTNETKAPELLPCPFCGGRAIHAKTSRGWKVECKSRMGSCSMNARTHYQPEKHLAYYAWNTRHDHALALVAAEREAWASEILTHIAAYKDIGQKGAYPPLNESFVNTILARTPDDAQAALEARDKRVREEALREAKVKIDSIDDHGNHAAADALIEARRIILDLIEGDTDE